jgi:hypothetical protein
MSFYFMKNNMIYGFGQYTKSKIRDIWPTSVICVESSVAKSVIYPLDRIINHHALIDGTVYVQ